MPRFIIVVTGLPASGKTTLAHLLGKELGFAVIDKDDFLETLLGSVQEFDAEFRYRCSREADELFEEATRSSGDVILVSHWKGPDENRGSGTPTSWLREFDSVIEVACQCSVATAVQRFKSRDRHLGHGDNRSDLPTILSWFEEDSLRAPLGLGPVISVNTETNVDIEELAWRVRKFF